MNYQSGAFLLFSAGVILLYYLAGRRLQKYVLLLANLAFFLIAGPKYIPFILTTMLASFFAGILIGRIYEKEAAELAQCQDKSEKKTIRANSKKRAKKILLGGLIITVGLLAVCKYSGFVVENINAISARFGLGQIGTFRMILPLGISFYTFMAVGYVLDVYWKRFKAEKNFILFAVFISYFPHVVQGPIDRYAAFKPQIENGTPFSYKNLTCGAQLVIWGFFKKLVIADRLGIFVDSVYDQWTEYTGVIFVLAAVVYALQIYADFSGCIDIVSGVSEMMGIKLAQNFNHPYFAKNIAEFWRRWHMSLTSWFKDYIYFPVSTSRLVKKAKKRTKENRGVKAEQLVGTSIPIAVVWLLTGLWHGATWGYIVWGVYYGVLMILSNAFSDFFAKLTVKLRINQDLFSWKLFQMGRTFVLTCIGRIIFRAETLRKAGDIFARIFQGFQPGNLMGDNFTSYGLDVYNILLAVFAVFVLWVVDMMQERFCIRDALAKEHLVFRWIVIILGVLSVLIFGMYGLSYDAASFIYGQF